MVKYIVGTLLILLVWAAWFLLDLHILIPIGVTVLIVAAVAAIVLFRWFRDKQRARELERALHDQAREAAKGMRPDLQAEVQHMQSEFEKAIGSLKSSKLGKGRDALYALPWYAIIGPPGVGKSTALRNSGLQFPYLSSSGGGIRGLGGTRNCDWWLTNEAVILDTAGRWTTQDEDKDEWLAFLDLVKRFRPRHPLNGIIVAVAVTDLGSIREDQLAGMSGQIRERIDEVMERLQMSLPVYLMFTKCDLLPGFVETFGAMTKQERGQIWGFTAPITKDIGEPGEYFGKRFDELGTILEARAVRRMAEERSYDIRGRVYAFPEQFQLLRRNLSDFVTQLFQANVFKETPRMRGAYFTSGTQEGRPIDLVMARMAEAFGIRGQLQAPDPVVEQKSYFLRDVFGEVIFKDSQVAVRSEAEARRQKMGQLAMAAAIFGLAVVSSSLPTLSFFLNRSFLRETTGVIESISPHLGPEGMMPAEAADVLRQRTETLEEGPSVFMTFGMYQGDVIYPTVRNFYAHVFKHKVLEPLVTAEQNDIRGFAERYVAMADARPTPEEYLTYVERLKLYMLLTGPREEGEPPIDDRLADWIVRKLLERWAAAAGVPERDPRREAMRADLALYLRIYREFPEIAFRRDPDTVSRTRAALARVPFPEVALGRLIDELDGRGYDMTLLGLVGTEISALTAGTPRIRGVFTRRGWEERVRDRLEEPTSTFAGEPWVLGISPDDASERAEADMAALRDAYFRQYANEWLVYLRALRAERPVGPPGTLTAISELIRGNPPPLGRLFRQLNYNVVLREEEDPNDARAGAAQDALGEAAQRRMQKLAKTKAGKVLNRVAESHQRRTENGGGTEPMNDPDRDWTAEDVRERFEVLTAFGVPPPTRGDEPPEVTSLVRYQEQLEAVLDALRLNTDLPIKLLAAQNMTRTLIAEIELPDEEAEADFERILTQLLYPPLDGLGPPPRPPRPGRPRPP